MPAFSPALSADDIQRVIDYVRGLCPDHAWPHGNLNMARPLVTEKAFPEDEAVVTIALPPRETDFAETRLTIEKRLGARGQVEMDVPFAMRAVPGHWNRGLGDVVLGMKEVLVQRPTTGSIFSAGADMTFPTGKEEKGLGGRLTVFEPFGTISQQLPFDGFAHLQAGFEVPLNIRRNNDEVFWRVAVGKTFAQRDWGRSWSPMVEVLGVRELEFAAQSRWDILPQLHVTLSRRQHITANTGIRTPLNLRTGRRTTLVLYGAWDWYEGGLFDGW
jgi:hypothetical protein